MVKKKDGSLEYYQVCYSLGDEKTIARELSPLQKIKDAFPKFIITADLLAANQEGITVKNVVN